MRLPSATTALAVLAVLTIEADAEPITFSADMIEIIGGMSTEQPSMRRSSYTGKEFVDFATTMAPGSIIIRTAERKLYYVLPGGRAVQYGIGVGREGYTWSGTDKITRKAEWPDWHPPAEMIARQPYLPRFMAGGPGNPLGARAMYLGSSVYRIHGTNDPSTIGKFVSSGCIRLTNEDVVDLFSRVDVGTKVVVLPKRAPHVEPRHLETRTIIGVRPARPAATLPSGRQAMNLTASQLN